jgi:hypothetical protein
MVLDNILNFLRDTILDLVENVLPQVKPEKLKLYAKIRRHCKSFQP